tara:strand:+ start:244 stop:516 length:273 start_codon:yes stop_codon:yes gene_type:complete
MKSIIEIHLIFADNIVARFTDLIPAYEFLVGHYAYLRASGIGETMLLEEDVLVGVLSSGLSTDDETFLNRQVALHQELQIRSNADDKIIQ